MILVIAMLICSLLTILGMVADKKKKMHFEFLGYMFFGSLLMWSVDLYTEFSEEGMEVFAPSREDAIDDLLLSLTVTATALLLWAGFLFIKRKSADRNELCCG